MQVVSRFQALQYSGGVVGKKIRDTQHRYPGKVKLQTVGALGRMDSLKQARLERSAVLESRGGGWHDLT